MAVYQASGEPLSVEQAATLDGGAEFPRLSLTLARVDRSLFDRVKKAKGQGHRPAPLQPPRFQERCHPFDPSIRGLEDMTNAPIQRGHEG
jgi:hypothetical protein